MLEFDAKTARLLEDAYQGSDAMLRRRANFDAVAPRPDETILDIGCGTGMLALDLARAVGTGGQVIGIDPSEDMLTEARARCGGRENIRLLQATAQAIPLDDESVDKAVSVQVFEYFDDISAPLRELHRVLRPGGRLVIGDTHWDSLIWHSGHPDRMARMITAYDRHLADRIVPQILPGQLSDTGYQLDQIRPVGFCDTTLRPDGLAQMIMRLMQNYAIQNELLPESEVAAWLAEQQSLARSGRFFFALTHYVCSAIRQ